MKNLVTFSFLTLTFTCTLAHEAFTVENGVVTVDMNKIREPDRHMLEVEGWASSIKDWLRFAYGGDHVDLSDIDKQIDDWKYLAITNRNEVKTAGGYKAYFWQKMTPILISTANEMVATKKMDETMVEHLKFTVRMLKSDFLYHLAYLNDHEPEIPSQYANYKYQYMKFAISKWSEMISEIVMFTMDGKPRDLSNGKTLNEEVTKWLDNWQEKCIQKPPGDHGEKFRSDFWEYFTPLFQRFVANFSNRRFTSDTRHVASRFEELLKYFHLIESGILDGKVKGLPKRGKGNYLQLPRILPPVPDFAKYIKSLALFHQHRYVHEEL